MAVALELPAKYNDARECLLAARRNLDNVRQLLYQPSPESGETAAAILREVDVQLGCIAAVWKAQGPVWDPELRAILADIQKEVAILAEVFAHSERLFDGWIRSIQTKRSGYTQQGQAAPLILVNQVNLEG